MSNGYAQNTRIWTARFFILLVTAWNIQCALVFLISPASFAAGFNLEGAIGAAIIRSIGLLFLMWNIPYAAALIHPDRWRVTLWVALIQQTIGVMGEIWIRSQAGQLIELQESLLKFILFDAAGILCLGLALLLVYDRNSRAG
jgi:hypothetical protein